MRHRRDYAGSFKIDPNSVKVNFISIDDNSGRSELRSHEIIELSIQMVRLASKRGPVAKVNEGEVDAAA